MWVYIYIVKFFHYGIIKEYLNIGCILKKELENNLWKLLEIRWYSTEKLPPCMYILIYIYKYMHMLILIFTSLHALVWITIIFLFYFFSHAVICLHYVNDNILWNTYSSLQRLLRMLDTLNFKEFVAFLSAFSPRASLQQKIECNYSLLLICYELKLSLVPLFSHS